MIGNEDGVSNSTSELEFIKICGKKTEFPESIVYQDGFYTSVQEKEKDVGTQ